MRYDDSTMKVGRLTHYVDTITADPVHPSNSPDADLITVTTVDIDPTTNKSFTDPVTGEARKMGYDSFNRMVGYTEVSHEYYKDLTTGTVDLTKLDITTTTTRSNMVYDNITGRENLGRLVSYVDRINLSATPSLNTINTMTNMLYNNLNQLTDYKQQSRELGTSTVHIVEDYDTAAAFSDYFLCAI